MRASPILMAVAAMTALSMPSQHAELIPRERRREPPLRLAGNGEPTSAHDLVRLAKKNARRRR